ncbi:hypothetical protein G3A39_41000 [Paraburkholderia aspalathi]|nr:hypothetical protein [Paraburkholderia aspalathi]
MNETPFRLRVLHGLTKVLEGVNPDNGFQFDMRNSVFRGRVKYGPKDPIPMISILEAPIPLDVLRSKGENPNSTGEWELLIQGFVKDDFVNPSDPAHHLMAEVKAALAAEKRRDNIYNMLGMEGRVVEMYIGQGTVRPPDDATDKAFFWLTLTLKLVEFLTEPYR